MASRQVRTAPAAVFRGALTGVFGEVKVDNKTDINLGSGNLEVASLTSTLGIYFNAGGSISSSQNIETQTGCVNMIAGAEVDAYKVIAKQ